MRVRNTKPACPPPSGITSFLPMNKIRKNRGKKPKTNKGQNFTPLENSSMLHTSQKKKGVRAITLEIPQHAICHLDGIFLQPLRSNLCRPPHPSCPSRPCIITNAGSIGTAPPVTAVRAAGVLGQETGEGNVSRRKREFICGDCLQKEWLVPSSLRSVALGALAADVSLPPSYSCCSQTCWSETFAEWRRSGCAVQCRSAKRGQNSFMTRHFRPRV